MYDHTKYYKELQNEWECIAADQDQSSDVNQIVARLSGVRLKWHPAGTHNERVSFK